jgi:glycosyltransferase involved in cell wall biosynthesis
VLLTADAVGGVWTYTVELVRALAEQGVEVVLATCGPPPSTEQRRQLPADAAAASHERPYALEWSRDALRDRAATADWLLELSEDEQVDLVHLNAYAPAAAPFAVPVVVVAHSCVLSWHQAVRGRPAGAEWSSYAAAVLAGLAAADAVVAPTAAMLAETDRLYRPPGERLVIPNGREADGLRPAPKQPYVLGVGRAWDEAKNVAALDRVAPQLDWPVLVAGASGDEPLDNARQLGFLPEPELHAHFASTAIFAAPVRYEPFGLAALEAGMAGCALVLGDLPSLREVWGEAAMFVDPCDDRQLFRALRALIADPARRRRYGRLAQRRALEYSSARMGAAYLGLYERLLPEQADRRAAATAGARR